MKDNKTRDMAYMAMYVALFAVLDYITRAIPFFKMPQGGSIGLGTIALLLASYHLGWKKGLLISLISIPVQFMIGSSLPGNITGFILDYLIGYGVYGLASLFPNFGFFYSGVAVVNLVRLAAATLAGTLVWETPLWASLVYNANYMIPTLLVGLVFVPLIAKRLIEQE